ncbi:MAG: ribosome maturation factor RimM [Bacteroidota bacterium]
MHPDECFLLGYVIKRHGLKGELSIFLDVDDPEGYSKLESVFVSIDGKLVPFFIERISVKGDRAVVQFEDVNSVDQADELKGCELFLPLTMLPKLEGTSFYYHEIIGFQVIDEVFGKVGRIKDIYTGSGQELLAVMRNDKEILVPVADDTIKSVDREKAEILVNLPAGLLDIYED